jgi:glutathione-specific gamma-glutamylcyclotransferase
MKLTRELLRDGTLRELLKAADPHLKLLSDEERAASVRSVFGDGLGAEDAWVFGYGSLLWNPTFLYDETRVAHLRGWHRRFCLWTPLGRGTPDRPGLMLGLERGGSCRGVAFRIKAEHAEEEIDILWRREMVSGAYAPRLVPVETHAGPVRAVAFVINRGHERYAGFLPDDEIARILADACGRLGTCAEYLFQTVAHLEELGVHDRSLAALAKHVRTLTGGPAKTILKDTAIEDRPIEESP